MTIGLEKIFFTYINKNTKYFDLVESFFFKNTEIQFVYNILKQYISDNKSSEIPTPRQIFEMVSLEDKDGIITKEILKSILSTNLSEYDEENFIIPKFNTWILTNKIKSGAIDIIEETRNLDNITDFEKAVESANKIKSIVEKVSSINFITDDSLGSDFDDVESHSQDNSRYKVKSGFNTLDHMLGDGWDAGSLNILMGETNSGKCFFGSSKLEIRSKKTGKIKVISGEKMFSTISKGNKDI